ncbi:hypothetical protein MMAN_21910 [Mycobacterium mantenii]|uniref:Mce/MlaD domain-containing protein n=1 Tax=Mycobacterium mantenii TaxID=560555 RepID=A0ABM7JRB9_MYCNT|nr:MlaD family protein [Mycobacterium mantenii]BBY38057.1 hypothetical protein MMAN_21910 [Mycobacterium mantenii]
MLSFIVFGLMIAGSVGYVGSLGVRVGAPPGRTNVSMMVADVNGLAVGSNVLLRGVAVGKVSNITTSIGGATIDFYIERQYRVPADCKVRLDNLSALGETYIGLFPQRQDGPLFRDGQRITTESVIQPPSITELAVTVARILSQVDSEAVERILGEVNTAMPNERAVLPNLSHASKLLRNTAADMHGKGRVLLGNFQTLLRNSGWLGPAVADITPGTEESAPAVKYIIDGTGELIYERGGMGQNLYRLDHLVGRLQKFLDNQGGDFKVLGEAFRPKVKAIAGALLNVDPSEIMANILATVPEDGAITLHVTIPQN